VILRTAPAVPPDPDLLRAMERLESQLRRAADDLARALGAARLASLPPPPEPPSDAEDVYRGRRRCRRWMPAARTRCDRLEGHRGPCRTREAMDNARRARRRAAA
jgi:hypothetical protein